MKNSRTATITSGLVPAAATLKALFGTTLASKVEHYENVTIENLGNLDVKVASMEKNAGSPATDDYVKLEPDESISFDRISSLYFFVSLDEPVPSEEPDLPDFYMLRFTGTPAQ